MSVSFPQNKIKRSFRGPGGVVRGLESGSRAEICARELAYVASRGLHGPPTTTLSTTYHHRLPPPLTTSTHRHHLPPYTHLTSPTHRPTCPPTHRHAHLTSPTSPHLQPHPTRPHVHTLSARVGATLLAYHLQPQIHAILLLQPLPPPRLAQPDLAQPSPLCTPQHIGAIPIRCLREPPPPAALVLWYSATTGRLPRTWLTGGSGTNNSTTFVLIRPYLGSCYGTSLPFTFF